MLADTGPGALVCSPGGPLALLCGAAAGVATWLAVDLVALELEEQLERERFEAELHEVLRAEEAALTARLQRLHAGWIRRRLEGFRRRVASPGNPPADYRPLEVLSDRAEPEAPAAPPAGSSAPR